MSSEHECIMIKQIENLIVSMQNHIETTKAATHRIEDLLYRHNSIIYGDENPGLKTKVAILEADSERRGKFNLMAVSAFLGTLGILIAEAWKSLKG